MSFDGPDIQAALAEQGWLEKVARGLTRSEDEKDDVLQDTWMVVLQQARPVQRLQGWLSGVVRRRAALVARSEMRQRTLREAGDEPTDRDDEKSELQKLVSRAVLDLDERHREVILLAYYGGLTGAEIGERLGVPASTVRTRLQRAHEQLRGRIRRDLDADRTPLRALLAPLLPAPRPPRVTGVAKGAAAFVMVSGLLIVTRPWESGPAEAREIAVAIRDLPASAATARRSSQPLTPPLQPSRPTETSPDRGLVAAPEYRLRGRVLVAGLEARPATELVAEIALARAGPGLGLANIRAPDALETLVPSHRIRIGCGEAFDVPVLAPGIYMLRALVDGVIGVADAWLTTEESTDVQFRVLGGVDLRVAGPEADSAQVVLRGASDDVEVSRVAPGRFFFAGPVLEPMLVGVAVAGLPDRLWTVARAHGPDPIELVLPFIGPQSVRVIGPGEVSLTDAVLTATFAPDPRGIWRYVAHANPLGVAIVPVAPFREHTSVSWLSVRADGRGSRTWPDYESVLARSGEETPVLTLPEAPRAGGKLIEDGRSVADAWVVVRRGGVALAAGRADARGEFSLRDISFLAHPDLHRLRPSGQDDHVDVEVRLAGDPPMLFASVPWSALEDGGWAGDMVSAAPPPTAVTTDRAQARLRFTVRGKGVAGALFFLRDPSGLPPQRLRTDDEGRVSAKATESGLADVVPSTRGLALSMSQDHRVRIDGDDEQDVRCVAVRNRRLRPVRADGSIPRFVLGERRVDGGARRERFLWQPGPATVPVPAEDHIVRLFATGARAVEVRLAADDDTISEALDVVFPLGPPLTVIVDRLPAAASLVVVPERLFAPGGPVELDPALARHLAERRPEIARETTIFLAPGRYCVQVRDEHDRTLEERRVDVAETTSVVIER